MNHPNPVAQMVATDSKAMREAIGVFDTEAELDAYTLTSPLAALKKCLGLKSLAIPPEIRAEDERIIARRRAAYGITGNVRPR